MTTDPWELKVVQCLDIIDKRERYFKQELDAMKRREMQVAEALLRLTNTQGRLLDRIDAAEKRAFELETRLCRVEEQQRFTADEHALGEIGRA